MDRRRNRLSRRQFVVGAGSVGLLAGCGWLPGQAAPAARVPRIGWLALEPRAQSVSLEESFQQGLRDFGYGEVQHILIEPRYADGLTARLPALAAELVQLPVDILVAAGGTTALAAHDATSTIPIVMMFARDPVVEGLVASLARPGGNVTGLTYFSRQLAPKRLELLHETVPSMTRVAYLWDRANSTDPTTPLEVVESSAQVLGLHLQLLEIREPGDVDAAFEAASREHAEGVFVASVIANSERSRVIALAAQSRLPAMYNSVEYVRAGGLMSYAPDRPAQYRRAAYYVDRILRGASPADLPVEQPMTIDFVVNLKTAQALGITFPNEIMLQVTEVLE
jgi:putative tryptophan/tyrosine transport system substrate-binding protein